MSLLLKKRNAEPLFVRQLLQITHGNRKQQPVSLAGGGRVLLVEFLLSGTDVPAAPDIISSLSLSYVQMFLKGALISAPSFITHTHQSTGTNHIGTDACLRPDDLAHVGRRLLMGEGGGAGTS